MCIFLFLFIAAHTQRLLNLQSMLRHAPSYRTLELQLIEWQERELFEYFVVVSLKKKPTKNSYTPEVTYQFPKVNILYKKGRCCFCFTVKMLHTDVSWKVLKVVYTSRFIKECLYWPSFRVIYYRVAIKRFPEEGLRIINNLFYFLN